MENDDRKLIVDLGGLIETIAVVEGEEDYDDIDELDEQWADDRLDEADEPNFSESEWSELREELGDDVLRAKHQYREHDEEYDDDDQDDLDDEEEGDDLHDPDSDLDIEDDDEDGQEPPEEAQTPLVRPTPVPVTYRPLGASEKLERLPGEHQVLHHLRERCVEERWELRAAYQDYWVWSAPGERLDFTAWMLSLDLQGVMIGRGHGMSWVCWRGAR